MQCLAFSRAVNYEKLLSPPFPTIGGEAVVTNDKCIMSWIYNLLVRIANNEDPNLTLHKKSDLGLHNLS